VFLKLVNSKKTEGLTLVELLVTLLIITILSGVVIWMLLAGKSSWLASEGRVALRQEIQVTAIKITKELQDSNIELITSNTSGSVKAFSFPSAFNEAGNFVSDPSGFLVWQKYVIYYIPAGTTSLVRREVTGRDFNTPLTIDELMSYSDGKGVKISPSIENLSLSLNKEDKSTILALKFKKTNRLGEIEEMSFETEIFILN